MCPAGIRMSVSKLWWLRIDEEYQGVSSQTGSTMTTKKDVVVSVDEARACRIAFCMSPGSYSGFAVHEHVRQ
jgi:outer membrane protein assembly factor BamA